MAHNIKIEWLDPDGPQLQPYELRFDQRKGTFAGNSVEETNSQNLEQPQTEHQTRDCKALCLFVCRVVATVPVFVAGTAFGTIHGIVCALILSFEVACMHFTDCCHGSLEAFCITSPCQTLACLIVTTMDIGIIMLCVPVTGFSFGGYNACLLLWNEKSIDDITIEHKGMSKLRLIDSSMNKYVNERFDEILSRFEEKSNAKI